MQNVGEDRLRRRCGINLPSRSSISFTLSGIITKGAALVLTPVFTRLLSSAEYGTYSLFNSYLSVMLVLGTLELGGNVTLRAFQRYRGKEYTVILAALLLTVPLSFFVMLGLFVFHKISGADLLFGGAYPLLFASLISSGITNLFISRAKFLYRPRCSIILSVINGILSPLIAIALIGKNAFPSLSRVAIKIGCTVLISFAICVCLAAHIVKRSIVELKELPHRKQLRLITDPLRLLIRLSLPMLPYYFAVMAISQSDKLAVSRYLGTSVLGGYSVAYSAGLAPICISQGLICALTPWVMRRTRAGEFSRMSQTLTMVFCILCALISAFLFTVPEIFSILAPQGYRDALPVAFITALAPLPLFLMNIESSVICAYERTLPTVICGCAVSILSVATVYNVTPRFGANAAAFTVVFAYCTIAVLQAFNIRRLSGHNVIDVSQCIRAFLLTALLSAMGIAFKEIPIARAVFLALPTASLIYMLKRARSLLKEQ